ncbi:MAG: hypothetical protein R3Y29_05840 [bacterium]
MLNLYKTTRIIFIILLVCFTQVSAFATSVHHFDCEEITKTGREERTFYAICPTNSDKHNTAKMHYYNASSEPVKIYANNNYMLVDAWSCNDIIFDVKHDERIDISIIGANNILTQNLNGYFSLKSYRN